MVISNEMLAMINDVALLFPAFLIVFTFRGFSKALAAKLNGDDTAYHAGFLTLNPTAHVDVIGMLVVLGVLFIVGGMMPGYFSRGILYIILIALGVRWTYHVPTMEKAFKNHTLGVFSTILAPPASNFVLALFMMYFKKYFPYDLVGRSPAITIALIANTVIDVALFFGVVDLIPIPPFDASALLPYIVPPDYHGILEWLDANSLFILLFLFLAPGVRETFFTGLFIMAETLRSVLYCFVL